MYHRSFRSVALGLLCVGLLWASGGAVAQGAGHEAKLDPLLRLALDQPGASGAARLTAAGDAPDTLEVIVSATRDVSDRIRALGGEPRTVLGGGALITAVVPRGVVRALAADPAVLNVDASKALHLMEDRAPDEGAAPREPDPLAVSVSDIRVPQAWALKDARGLPIRGKDVIVGVLDTGIDLKHRDFKNPAGGSRIHEGVPSRSRAYASLR